MGYFWPLMGKGIVSVKDTFAAQIRYRVGLGENIFFGLIRGQAMDH